VNLRPLHDRIIVKRVDESEQTSASGIIIPDSAKEKPQEAEVIAVGKGKRQENGDVTPLDVKAGDKILIGKYSGNEVKIGDQDYVIIREDEVLAVIE
jgi:chaperonin GroES